MQADAIAKSTQAGRRRAMAALLLAILLWGSTFIITKEVLAEIGPFTLTFLRFLIGLGGLWPFARRAGFRPAMALRPAFLGFGLTGLALFYAFQNLGLVYTTAGNASLIEASIPAVTAILSFLVLRERITRRRVAGIALTMAGVALVSGTQPAGAGHLALLGDALVFGAVLSFAIYTVQGKRLLVDHPPAVTTAASFAAGLLFLLPAMLIELALGGLPRPGPAAWAIVFYLGLATSALTLFLWNYALQFLDSSAAALYTSLVPAAGLGFAWLLGEPGRLGQIAGGLLAMAGVWLGNRPAANGAGAREPRPKGTPSEKDGRKKWRGWRG